MLKDRYGNSISTRSQAARDHFDTALELIQLYRGDPIAALDAALAEDSDFGGAWAVRAALLTQQMDKAYAEETERSLRAGLAANLTERERALMAAALDWNEGRFQDGAARFFRVSQEHPRDLFAVQSAHVGCFFLGLQHELRDWPLQALRAFRRGDEGYGALLGMIAFGQEECGAYELAEEAGRTAVEIDPRDGWAVHAVAHVNEMRGDTAAGVPWLRDSAEAWAPESGFAYHNWWHLALLHLDGGDARAALRVYDEKVRPDPDAQILMEWIDASGLMWRLFLEGVDLGDRAEKIVACWARAGEDAFYAFNDLHAIMAFLAAGRTKDAERTLHAMRLSAADPGDNGYMTRAVGLPLAEGFVAYAAGRYGEAVEKIAAVRGIAQRFGGSHAQRDILSLTALHAALKGGMRETARAFASERVAHKPQSPWAGRLMRQAEGVAAAA